MANRPPHVQQFIDQQLPLARRGAEATGLPVSLVLAQWACESAWGRAALARAHNLGAITRGGRMATYASPDDFLSDWVRVMHLPWYAEVLRAAAAHRPLEEIVRLLALSPYDATQYRAGPAQPPGSLLLRVITGFALTEYDPPVQRLSAAARSCPSPRPR